MGSRRVILVVPGILFIIKLSPSIIAAAMPESLKSILSFSEKRYFYDDVIFQKFPKN